MKMMKKVNEGETLLFDIVFGKKSDLYVKDKRVVLNNNALIKSLVYYATTQKLQGDMEIMGWLAGNIKDDVIEVVDCYIGNCKSHSTYTELDPLETLKMKNKAKEQGLQLIGQWHCHPNMTTNPSGVDKDTLVTLKSFGIQLPVMLIVNDKDFWLGTLQDNKLKKFNFIIPEVKDDNITGFNLDFVNGEYNYFDINNNFNIMQEQQIEQPKDVMNDTIVNNIFTGLESLGLLIFIPFVIFVKVCEIFFVGISDLFKKSYAYVKEVFSR